MRISSRRLGELLVSRRVLQRDALEELLAREATAGVPLSGLLLQEGLVSAHDLVAAIATELGVPFVDLADPTIPPDVWGAVPEDLARAHLAVALERRPDGVLVAMEDPSDDRLLAALEEALGSPVVAAVATRDDLERLVAQMYGPGEGTSPSGAPTGGQIQLRDLLNEVVRVGGSDLHLTVGTPPLVRVQGVLRRIPGVPALTGSDTRRLVLGVLTRAQQERFLEVGELSSSHAVPGRGRFRVSAFVQRDSVGAVMRMVPPEIPPAEDLGLPDEVISWVDARRGLVLVCGPHGSGTSTTLAALVDRINRSRAAHILTVEDPIEFLHRHRTGVVNQREVGEDTASIATGLRAALRQDPDVVVASDLPDLDSLRLALTAAETGHLVLASLRTMTAVQTVERIVDVFPVDQQPQARVQLANTLRGIVVQQLVPAVDGGFALATEVLLPTPVVLECIREGDSANLAKAILGGATSGMGTMDQSLAALVQDGIVAPEVAADRAVDRAEVAYLVGEASRG